MSTRERWIVYPLLFLALGTAIKPKLIHPQLADTALPPATLRIERVECAELTVLGRKEQPVVRAHASSSGGVIEVLDAKRRKVVSIRADAATRAGLIETQNDQGRPQAALMSNAAGGELAAYDNSLNRSVTIGFRDGRSGLIQTDLRTGKESFEPTAAPD